MNGSKSSGAEGPQQSESTWWQSLMNKHKGLPTSRNPDAIKLKLNFPLQEKNSSEPARLIPNDYVEILKALPRLAPSQPETQKTSLPNSLMHLQKATLASEASILLGTLRDFLSVAKTTGEKCGKEHLAIIVREFNLRKNALKNLTNSRNSNESPIFATPELNQLFNHQKPSKPKQVRSKVEREKLVGKIMIDHFNDAEKLTQQRIKEIALADYNIKISEKRISMTKAYRSMFQKNTDSDCLTDEFQIGKERKSCY